MIIIIFILWAISMLATDDCVMYGRGYVGSTPSGGPILHTQNTVFISDSDTKYCFYIWFWYIDLHAPLISVILLFVWYLFYIFLYDNKSTYIATYGNVYLQRSLVLCITPLPRTWGYLYPSHIFRWPIWYDAIDQSRLIHIFPSISAGITWYIIYWYCRPTIHGIRTQSRASPI